MPDRWLPNAPGDKKGTEHHVFPLGIRWLKYTQASGAPGYMGVVAAAPDEIDESSEWVMLEALPSEYLERLINTEVTFPTGIHFHGVWVDGRGWARMVISQADAVGDPVSEATIEEVLAEAGFEPLGGNSYYRDEDNLFVMDAHEENVIETEQGLFFFDVHAIRPTGYLRRVIEIGLRRRRQNSS